MVTDSGSASPTHASQAPAPSNSFSWGLPLLLAGAAIVAGYFMFRRQAPAPQAPAGGYVPQGGLSGPQAFGMGNGMGGAAGGYAQPPAGSGMGGRILGGVATGLAVGAGVMAAEALGRNLFGGHHNGADGRVSNDNDYQSLSNNTGNTNPDMGGADFGINDGGGWDSGGGGDWDN